MSNHMHEDGGYFFDDPQNRKRVRQVLYILCAVFFVADFVLHRHVDHPWEELPAFYCVYAFAAIVVLIFAAKALRFVAMRKEDYYDD